MIRLSYYNYDIKYGENMDATDLHPVGNFLGPKV